MWGRDYESMEEQRRLNNWIAVILLFLVSGYFALDELKMMVVSRSAVATVTDARVVAPGVQFSREESLRLAITYTTERGWEQTGEVGVSPDEAGSYPPGTKIRVVYVPGAQGSARLAGGDGIFAAIPFFVMVGVLVVVGGRFCLAYYKEQRLDAERKKPYSTVER